MKSLRISTMAATLLFALSGIAFAAAKQPQLVPQSGAQPKAAKAHPMGSGVGLMARKHNFLASGKVSARKDKAHGWVATATAGKGNTK